MFISLHSGYADHHVGNNVQNNRETHDNLEKCIPIVGGDFNAELGPGYGTECTSVGKHTLNGGNKRGDWMKHWLMVQSFTAPNTMCRKNPGKQTIYRSPEGNEKQIDHIITKRRHLNKDAEANDMIHMGSDHRLIQQNTTEGIKLGKTLGKRSLSSKEDTKISLKN